MNHTLGQIAVGAVLLAAMPGLTHAQTRPATVISSQQIIVLGNQNVEARSINNHGVIVASLYAGITDAASGIKIDGDTVTTLPAPYANGGPPHPRVIDDAGDVLGWALDAGPNPRLFLQKNGKTQPQYEITIAHEEEGQNFIIQPVGLTHRAEVFGTIIVSYTAPNTSFYGVPPHLRTVPSLDRFQHVNSMNKSGLIGGMFFSFSGRPGVFAGKTNAFKVVSPPNAVTSTGGYVNDAGELAGAYVDSAGAGHGFTLSNGIYTSFDMPQPASAVTVTAINSTGRIAGVYTDAKSGTQHGFLYNGTVVTAFGQYRGDDTILVAMNDIGDMLVDRQLYDFDPHFQSFRVSCKGAGC